MDGKSYFVRIGDDWHLFKNTVSVYDLVIKVANYTGNGSQLLLKALKGCTTDEDYIAMYNTFAISYQSIAGVWELGDHIYGDEG